MIFFETSGTLSTLIFAEWSFIPPFENDLYCAKWDFVFFGHVTSTSDDAFMFAFDYPFSRFFFLLLYLICFCVISFFSCSYLRFLAFRGVNLVTVGCVSVFFYHLFYFAFGLPIPSGFRSLFWEVWRERNLPRLFSLF